MSSLPHTSTRLTPSFPLTTNATESPTTKQIIQNLNLLTHIEGGYFAEIDRNPLLIPNPFPNTTGTKSNTQTASTPFSGNDKVRNASTSIYYLLSEKRPQGHFHRNRGRTVHTLIEGRGRYVLIHADEVDGGVIEGDGARAEEQDVKKARIETFVVGKDVSLGERSVWIVEGGKYKASYLLPYSEDGEGGEGENRLLISETVIPGFEYCDHDFLTMERVKGLITEGQVEELEWLVRKE